MTVDVCQHCRWALLLYCRYCILNCEHYEWINVFARVHMCVHLSVWWLCNDCTQMCVRACVSMRQFSWAFSQAPLSLHKCVCLSRSQPVRVCMIVSVCLRQSKRTRESEWVTRDGRERGNRERRQRDWGRGVMAVAVYWVCYLARGLHNFPTQMLLCHPLSAESATHSTGTFVSTRHWPR